MNIAVCGIVLCSVLLLFYNMRYLYTLMIRNCLMKSEDVDIWCESNH